VVCFDLPPTTCGFSHESHGKDFRTLEGIVIPRREALYALLAFLLAPSRLSAQGQDDDWKAALQDAISNKTTLTLGHKIPPPDDISWKEAHAILSGAPLRGTPFAVANYFVNSIPTKYQQAWPEPDPNHPTYANPVIVLLFLATKTVPSGDTTAWCSAFVNWCLGRVGILGTKNASSQSFADLNWGREVWSRTDSGLMPISAKTGDIAIFQHLSDPRYGHVCFFQKISEDQPKSVEVLGGNQIVRSGRQKLHLIDVKTLRIDGDLQLRSIRTNDGLRNV
jgi:uncharacterized protein (TIGR02594 family)